ncbi:hypothetical protein HOY80DRAFT_997435 [Tuber brumale]|nr:hypothetical protein HOY80DRAFT_997435 [Tuber brumale]
MLYEYHSVGGNFRNSRMDLTGFERASDAVLWYVQYPTRDRFTGARHGIGEIDRGRQGFLANKRCSQAHEVPGKQVLVVSRLPTRSAPPELSAAEWLQAITLHLRTLREAEGTERESVSLDYDTGEQKERTASRPSKGPAEEKHDDDDDDDGGSHTRNIPPAPLRCLIPIPPIHSIPSHPIQSIPRLWYNHTPPETVPSPRANHLCPIRQ